MKRLMLLTLLLCACTLKADNIKVYPSNICSSEDIVLQIVDLSYCAAKKAVSKVTFLGLTHQTAIIKTSDKEITIGINPAEVAIGNLHQKYDLSINQFFIKLFSERLPRKDAEKIKLSFDINSDSITSIFKKDKLYAFSIVGNNKEYDRIYLNKKGSDTIYQITGEFNEKQLVKILAAIDY